MMDDLRDWKIYNQRLVNRGRVITILIEPTLLESESLQKMNKNKRGRQFKFCTGLISAAFAVKCVFRIGYRELEGFMRDISDRLHKSIPNFRTIWWRIDKMKDEGIKFNIQQGKNIVIAIDSTGLRPVNDGEYRSMRYDNRKEWIKLHAVVDVESKQILNIKITKGNVHDSTQFKSLTKPLSKNISIVLADRAYCSTEIYEFCDKNNIIPDIPVKLNFTNHYISSKMRRKILDEQLGINSKPGSSRINLHLTKEMKLQNLEKWKRKVGYGRRSIIESSFSRYKRIIGENVFSRKSKNIEKEIVAKVNILNKFAVT